MKYFLAIISFTFLSCGADWDPYKGKNYIPFTDESFPDVINLTHESTIMNSDSMVFPGLLRHVDNKLILAENKGKYPYHIFDLATNEYFQRGEFGKGPNEVLVPWMIHGHNSDSTFVYDIMQKKILMYNLDSLIDSNKASWEEKVLPQESISGFQYSDSKFYYTSFERDERIHSLDLKTKEVESFGKLLDKKNGNSQVQIHGQLNQAFMTMKGDVIMIGYMLVPVIEFFNVKTKEWKSFKGPEDFIPTYKEDLIEGSPVFTYKNETRTCYLGLCSSEKYFYALYDGESIENTKGFPQPVDVYVFDLDGNYVKHYKLDKGLNTLCVVDDETLYGIHLDMKPELIKFSLK